MQRHSACRLTWWVSNSRGNTSFWGWGAVKKKSKKKTMLKDLEWSHLESRRHLALGLQSLKSITELLLSSKGVEQGEEDLQQKGMWSDSRQNFQLRESTFWDKPRKGGVGFLGGRILKLGGQDILHSTLDWSGEMGEGTGLCSAGAQNNILSDPLLPALLPEESLAQLSDLGSEAMSSP